MDVYDGTGNVDWSALHSAGYTFAIIKATEGTGNVQDTFLANRRNAPAAGISPLGLYHFARPENGNPEAQADHFCDVVGTVNPDEFVALDIETGEESTWPDFIQRWFARVLERLGEVPTCLYMSDDPASRMPASIGRWPLWVAGYGANTGQPPNWGAGYEDQYSDGSFEHSWPTGPWSTWSVWQFTSKGSVPGIAGDADLNLAPDDLWARLGTQPPAVVPGLEHQHPTFAARVSNLCRSIGCTVYSGARSTEEQAELYRRYQAGTGNPANPPGTSWHEYGPELVGGPYATAVDLDGDLVAANARAAEFGLCFPVSSELWHCQPWEIVESSRVDGAQERIPELPTELEEAEVALVIVPVHPGEEVSLPLPQQGNPFGWSKVSVTLTAGPEAATVRAVIGPDWHGLDPDHPEDLVIPPEGRTFSDLGAQSNVLQVRNDSTKQSVGVMVEAK